MNEPSYSFKQGRVWLQLKKFQSYTLFLPYGITDISDPNGTLNPVREPHPSRRRASVVNDMIRSEPGLPGFTLETRLKQSLNYLLGLKSKTVNVQCHVGVCGNADDYVGSEVALGWDFVQRGDAAIDRGAQIEGDDGPIALTAPFMARVGPTFTDFRTRFLSARMIAETQDLTGIAILKDECDDISTQHDPGDIVYVSSKALSGSPVNVANVWASHDAGESWAEVVNSAGAAVRPFAAAVDISDIVVNGQRYNHVVVVSNGTADGANPASIARSVVTRDGIVSWANYDVGAVNGQFITRMFWVNYSNLYAVTNDGYVYKSGNGGVTWTAKLTTAVERLNAIVANLDGDVWVSGENGTLYHSTDGGDAWDAVDLPTAVSATDDSKAVGMSPDGTVFVGFAGGLYGSFNEGISWFTLPLDEAVAEITDIEAYDDSHVWLTANTEAGAGLVMRSTDGGANFKLWELNVPDNAGINALSIVNQNYAFVAGDAYNDAGFVTKTQSKGVGVITA